MDTNIAPVWSLFQDGTAHSTSKKSCLETAIAIAYLSALMAQREDSGAIYKPFLSRLIMIERQRRVEFQSWFHDDPTARAIIDSLFDNPEEVMGDQLMTLCIGNDVAEWAIHMVPYLALAHKWDIRRLVSDVPVPFYGLTVTGDLYQTTFGIPFRRDTNAPITVQSVPFPDYPFFRIINYFLSIAIPDMQDAGVQAILLNNVRVQTDPLRRMIGDTLITALWEDTVTEINACQAIYKVGEDEALPNLYTKKAAEITGLQWLRLVVKSGDPMEGGVSISSVCSVVDRLCRAQYSDALSNNPNYDGMSLESLQATFMMADDPTPSSDDDDGNTPDQTTQPSTPASGSQTDTSAPSTTPAQPDQQNTDTSATPASTTDTSDDGAASGEAEATSTDTPTSDDTTPAAVPDTTGGDTTPADGSEPSPDENNIAGLSFDTSGENREDYLYRRGVLALANAINDDMDFPVSDEVRNLLKAFVEVWLFKVSIGDVKDYMKKLGLQSHLEAVSF